MIAQKIEQVETQTDISEKEKTAIIEQLEYKQGAVLNENSYIGRFGHAIEPFVSPCGFDWRMGVSLTTGIAAKEVVVSTLAVLFQTSEDDGNKLVDNVRTQVWNDGPKKGELLFTPLVAFGFMLFVLLSTPCFATITAVRREAGWKGVLFTVFYNTGIAWIVSFLVYQIGSLF